MSNSYFRFKQFSIEQDRCAMKVTTDACIQGAWTPVDNSVRRVLDIGAGTGLLALMLAQRSSAVTIDAIEFDADAAAQAKENAASSPWADRINIIHADVKGFLISSEIRSYHHQPPFFNNSLLGDDAAKNRARHTLSLSYAELLMALGDNLGSSGHVSILLPAAEYLVWQQLASQRGWSEQRRLSVRHKPGSKINRVVGIMSRHAGAPVTEEELIIYGDDGKYSPEFIELLSPFYLNL